MKNELIPLLDSLGMVVAVQLHHRDGSISLSVEQSSMYGKYVYENNESKTKTFGLLPGGKVRGYSGTVTHWSYLSSNSGTDGKRV